MNFERDFRLPPSLFFLENPAEKVASEIAESILTEEENRLFEEFSDRFLSELNREQPEGTNVFEKTFQMLPHTRKAVNKFIALTHMLKEAGRDA